MSYQHLFADVQPVEPPRIQRRKLPKQEDDLPQFGEFLFDNYILQPVKEYNIPIIGENEDLSLDLEEDYDIPYEAVNNNSPVQQVDNSLLGIDIEDLLRSEGITSINGKRIKFGNKRLRAANAPYGVKNSNHKRRDPYTGNAMARDISIIGGTTQDYADFRQVLLSNPRVVQYMATKGWGIINEITPAILARTRGTGPHFHFGPDRWAKRIWNAWLNNPTISITRAI